MVHNAHGAQDCRKQLLSDQTRHWYIEQLWSAIVLLAGMQGAHSTNNLYQKIDRKSGQAMAWPAPMALGVMNHLPVNVSNFQ